MNITKFGAFVNILPGRDGLVHISKMGGGKRIDRVEDVLDLGDEIEVRVDDVDPNGKVVAQPGHARSAAARATVAVGGGDAAPPAERVRASLEAGGGDDVVSFEDAFDAEVREEFGDLGPAAAGAREGSGGGGRGGDRGGRSGGRRGGGRGGDRGGRSRSARAPPVRPS